MNAPLRLCLLVVYLTCRTAAGQQCGGPEVPVTELGRVKQPNVPVTTTSSKSVDFRPIDSNARYVRLLIRPAMVAPGEKWLLTIRDPSLRVLETVTESRQKDEQPIWTKRIYTTGMLNFELTASASGASVVIEQAIVMPENAEHPFYSLRDPNAKNFSSLYEADSEFRRLGDYVGFVTVSSANRSWCCTAGAVGENLVLTNYHCDADYESKAENDVWSQDVCDRTFIDFSWDGDQLDREFRCVHVLDKNRANDFAILRIASTRPGDRVVPAPTRGTRPVLGEFVRIVHHPACGTKQLSKACRVDVAARAGWTSQRNDDFAHGCDTEGGSSGAPIFDAQNRVIGIHHLGFALKSDGTCDFENKGVSFVGILQTTKKETADLMRNTQH